MKLKRLLMKARKASASKHLDNHDQKNVIAVTFAERSSLQTESLNFIESEGGQDGKQTSGYFLGGDSELKSQVKI